MPHPVHANTLLLLTCLLAPAAQACGAFETGGSLGSFTTHSVNSGTAIRTAASFAFGCGGSVLAIANGTPSLRGEFVGPLTGLTLKSGTNAIPYQIYSDAGFSTAFPSLLRVNLVGAQLLSLLSAGTAQIIPFYIGVTPGANVPRGVYTDALQFTWTPANICEGLLGLLGICLGVASNTPVTRTLNVTLTVNNDCTVTAPPVNFGTAPLAASFSTVSQNIQLLCSRDMVYTVGLSAGSNTSAGRRQMASSASRLQYDIFKADNTVWGSAGTARANGPAPATGDTWQTIPYTARVYPDQTNPPPGVYTDNVVVDVSF